MNKNLTPQCKMCVTRPISSLQLWNLFNCEHERRRGYTPLLAAAYVTSANGVHPLTFLSLSCVPSTMKIFGWRYVHICYSIKSSSWDPTCGWGEAPRMAYSAAFYRRAWSECLRRRRARFSIQRMCVRSKVVPALSMAGFTTLSSICHRHFHGR